MELSPEEPMTSEYGDGLTRRELTAIALGVGAGALLTSCTSETSPSPQQLEVDDCSERRVHLERSRLTPDGVDLTRQEWSIPGVEQDQNRLHVSPCPITIIEKDGRDRATLPIWPDRRFDTLDLRVKSSVQLHSPKTETALSFVAELPTTYDDFQFPGKGMRVTVTNQSCTLEVWDGQHKDPKVESFALPRRSLHKDIEIIKKAGRLEVVVDGRAIKELEGFSEKHTWIGLEARKGECTVDTLRVSSSEAGASIADMTTLKVEECDTGLRDIAVNDSCAIGAAIALTPLLENAQYAAITTGNFSAITTENSLKPQFVHPEEGIYAFEETERLIAFADRHDMQVHGHALLPNRSMPEWMRTLSTETIADKARVREVMVDHITTIMKHFPMIQSWDVVNEALEDRGWREDTVWYRAMGDEFINIAFAAAHKANPNAMLFINDYSMDKAGEYDESRFRLLLGKLQIVRKENQRALVGIGFEGHVYQTPRDCMSPNDVRRRMKAIMNNGMVTRVSEMDVTTHHDGSPDTTEQGLRLQAQQFGEIAKVCMESPACVSFTTWGIGGRYVSTAGVNDKGELTWGSNLPWDKDLKQRPLTYRALQQALSSPLQKS